MANHIQITFTGLQPEQQDVLIAHLSEAGYDGFEETIHDLKAFIDEKDYNKTFLEELACKYQLSYSEQTIPEQNWNAVWESNFQPVVMDDFLSIRAHFHEPIKTTELEIVITPKMSFGTGHHATTYMMAQQMRDISFTGKSVFDFGTGTGILAILAEKLGAKEVVAVDNDDWSISNAEENIRQNSCGHITLYKAETATRDQKFDIILANINKNIIMENFPALSNQLLQGGVLLLSGLLAEDEADISRQASLFSLSKTGKAERNGWICLKFSH